MEKVKARNMSYRLSPNSVGRKKAFTDLEKTLVLDLPSTAMDTPNAQPTEGKLVVIKVVFVYDKAAECRLLEYDGVHSPSTRMISSFVDVALVRYSRSLGISHTLTY